MAEDTNNSENKTLNAGGANNNEQLDKKSATKNRKKASAGKASAAKTSKSKKAKPAATKAKNTASKTASADRMKKDASKKQQSRNDSLFANMEKIMTNSYKFDKLAQEAQDNGKESMEAFAQSGSLFAKGFEDIMKTYISWAQESAEKNSQAFKALMGCKTLNDLTEAQSQLARENFDDFLNGVTRLSEMSVKVTTDAFEPINDQLSKTIRKASEAAAA